MSRWSLAGWLVGHTRPLLPPLILSVLARIANQLLGIALLVIAATALGRAAAGDPVSVGALVAWLAGLALLKAGLRYAEHYVGHGVAFAALQRLRELFFARLAPQAPAATSGRAGADLAQRATRDIDRIEVFFAHTLPPAVSAVVVPAVTLTWLAVAVDPLLAVVATPVVVAALVVPVASSGATWRAARRVAEARGALATRIGDDVQGIREVLAFGAQDARLAGLDAEGRALTAARAAAARVQAARTAATALLQMLLLLVPAAVGLARGLPVAEIALALVAGVALWVPLRGVEAFAAGLDAVFAATERIRDIIEADPAVTDPADAGPGLRGSAIALEAVTVHHPGAETPALHDVTAVLPAGAWSVVVGASGSGKSTLAALLMRGLDPQKGAVRIGGADVRRIPLGELRGRVALVSQRPTLLAGTLADNLRLAAPDASDEALRDAIATAALDEWVASLPRGLDTPVRERGVTVSGGQLQRLALARALVAAPEILVLDEALSQLDAATARNVRERILARRPALTVIEVTHRADLVEDDAPVLVLDGGRLVEQGLAGELRGRDGAFARLEARI